MDNTQSIQNKNSQEQTENTGSSSITQGPWRVRPLNLDNFNWPPSEGNLVAYLVLSAFRVIDAVGQSVGQLVDAVGQPVDVVDQSLRDDQIPKLAEKFKEAYKPLENISSDNAQLVRQVKVLVLRFETLRKRVSLNEDQADSGNQLLNQLLREELACLTADCQTLQQAGSEKDVNKTGGVNVKKRANRVFAQVKSSESRLGSVPLIGSLADWWSPDQQTQRQRKAYELTGYATGRIDGGYYADTG